MESLFFGWEYDDIPTADQCDGIIREHSDILSMCVHGSWNEWMNDIPEDTRAKISPMHRGGFIHSLIISRAATLFADQADAKVCEALRFFKVYLGDRLLVRFKKLRKDYSVCLSDATDQCRRFYDHAPIFGLNNSCGRLTCGYILDAAEEEIAEVAVTCQVKDTVLWHITLDSSLKSCEPQISFPKQPTIEFRRMPDIAEGSF